MNNNEVLVKVENLSKKFCKDLKTSLWYGVQDLYSTLHGNKATRELRNKEFWAVKDINFELRRGECLGLIGHNGAGKSTLLKILNGLINPDAGKVTIKGRVGALIELGAGFNPILTGRENIYNNGAVLGFSKKEIDAKVEDIIDFAEIREFIDMPVQNYSSGMKVRLGFAVAAQMEPDVLLIDEVLAVGDLGFVLKCFKTIDTILPNTAIIFVSHSMPMVSRICSQIILMENGISKSQGNDVSKAIDLYYTRFAQNESNVVFDDGSIELIEVKILSKQNEEGVSILNWNDDLILELTLNNFKLSKLPFITLSLFDKEQRGIAELLNPFKEKSIEKGIVKLSFVIKKIQLSKGIYSVNLIIASEKSSNPLLRINNICSFQVSFEYETWPPFLLETEIKTL